MAAVGSAAVAETVPAWLTALAKNGDQVAIRHDEQFWSYQALCWEVDRLRHHLLAQGVRAGERVLIVLPNGFEHVAVLLAVTAMGAIAVPVTPDIGIARLEWVCAETSPCLAVVGEDAQQAIQTIAVAQWSYHVGSAAPPRQTVVPMHEGNSPSCTDMALIRFSSGTAGRAKGAMLSHYQMLWTARTLAQVFGIDAAHRELMIAPVSHSGAWQRVAATLYAGGTVLFNSGPRTVSTLFEDVAQHRVSGFFTPPPLARVLLDADPEAARSALQSCLSVEIGSAPLSGDELRRLLDVMPQARVFFHYGLTECSRALILDARAHPDKLHTVGRPAPGVSVRLMDAEGGEVAAGEAGEIHLRGPQRVDAYWRRPDLNAVRFRDGWLATGDYGRLDDDGFLIYLGRRDDQINNGGFCFFPSEAEALLGSVPGITQYLIVGVTDPRGVLGVVPWALVVPAVATAWSPRPFLQQAKRCLPSYMVPRQALAVPQLCLTHSGKPDRRRTVEHYQHLITG